MNFLRKLVYRAFYSLVRKLFEFFYHFEVSAKVDLKSLSPPMILASNHGAWFDPFLIVVSLPKDSKLFPISFAAWYKYYYLFWPLMKILGAFPVKKKIGLEKTLAPGLRVLEKGGCVGIFPEGRRHRRGRVKKPRRGVGFLAIKSKAKVLPIKIEGNKNLKFLESILRKRKIKIKIGPPLTLTDFPDNMEGYQRAAEEVYKVIKAL